MLALKLVSGQALDNECIRVSSILPPSVAVIFPTALVILSLNLTLSSQSLSTTDEIIILVDVIPWMSGWIVFFLQEEAEPAQPSVAPLAQPSAFQLKAELTELSDDDPSAVALQPAAGLQPAKTCSKRKKHPKKLVPGDMRAKISKIVWSVCQCRAKASKSKGNCLEQFRSESFVDDLTTLNLRLRRLAKFDMDVEAWVSVVRVLNVGLVI